VVIQDLPVGVSGGGSDAWADQGLIPDDVHIGAPPDAFNAAGQDWGSPPLVPWRLRARDYEPLVRAVRATISGAGGLRIDHVMGLFRLWWVPADSSPTDGAYIRYPSRELLDIVALESHRARAIVVGEDLGTVEAGVREELAARALLSYRLLVFEKPDPEHWPTSALAAVSTHDLPTIAGLWTGSDVDEQVDIGVRRENALASQERMREMLRTGLAPTATVEEAIEAAHEQLARTPSMLVSATLEDAVAEQRRPNIPGAMNRPNWCIPLSVTLEELMQHPGPGRIAAALARRLTPAG
jgi:4-alpha-glucanotransferase